MRLLACFAGLAGLGLFAAFSPLTRAVSGAGVDKKSDGPRPTKRVSDSGYDLRPIDRDKPEWRKLLTSKQFNVTCESGTEAAFNNEYWNQKGKGVYVSVIGGLPLFSSDDKFDSGTGWPSFKKPIDPDHVLYREDGTHGFKRVEVLEARSGAHLGHVFDDGPPPAGKRYCMNSAALKFIADGTPLPPESLPLPHEQQTKLRQPTKTQEAMFGAGCFWGVEELFRALPGVIETDAGYSGGAKPKPTYKEVCGSGTGHAEVVHLKYDPDTISYEKLLDVFWTNHDPTQVNRQGPDVGDQYRSVIFFYSPEQQTIAEASKKTLQDSGKLGSPIATKIEPAKEFWPAEAYHQEYLKKRGMANCHTK